MIDSIKALVAALSVALATCGLSAMEYHVSPAGNNGNDGSVSKPFKTISAAAAIAQPGDVITGHEGIYRERVNPPRGGTSDVLCDKDGNKGFTIASGKARKTLTVGYIHPPFELREGEALTLRIFIDKNMAEVFANDRQAAVAWHEYEPNDLHVSLFSKGGDLKCKTVSSWKMNSLYRKAQRDVSAPK